MHEILQHTADVRIRVVSATLDSLFAEALLALMEVLGGEPGQRSSTETVEVEAPEATLLMVDFLSEALSRCHIRRQVYLSAAFARLTETSLSATLQAAPVGAFDEDVKAVTYHEADVRRQSDGSWTTTLVLDI